MKRPFSPLAFAAGLGSLLISIQPVLAQSTTAFTYQGQLQSNGSLASGTYTLTFSLFNASGGGSVVAGPVTNNTVVVTNGLFTVLVDFGPAVFTGTTNWLEIGVETNGVDTFTTLAPRQQLTSVPQSIYALNAGTAALAASATNFSGSVSGDVSGTQGATVVATVGGQTAANVASGVIAANGATSSNTPGAIVSRATAAGVFPPARSLWAVVCTCPFPPSSMPAAGPL